MEEEEETLQTCFHHRAGILAVEAPQNRHLSLPHNMRLDGPHKWYTNPTDGSTHRHRGISVLLKGTSENSNKEIMGPDRPISSFIYDILFRNSSNSFNLFMNFSTMMI